MTDAQTDLAAKRTALKQTVGDPVTEKQKVVDQATANLSKANSKADIDKARTALDQANNDLGAAKNNLTGLDSNALTLNDDFVPDGTEANKVGLFALEQVDLFDLLWLPFAGVVYSRPRNSKAHHETPGTARKSCLNCRQCPAKLDAQEVRLNVLEGTVARLQEQLAAARKEFSTSSKPPSSDIVKPPKPAPPEGQAGAASAGNRVTPNTNAPTSRLN